MLLYEGILTIDNFIDVFNLQRNDMYKVTLGRHNHFNVELKMTYNNVELFLKEFKIDLIYGNNWSKYEHLLLK